MGGEKYMLTYVDDATGVAQLTRKNGGACVGMSSQAVIIGFWKKDQVDSNGRPQNMEDVFGLVGEMVQYLKDNGL